MFARICGVCVCHGDGGMKSIRNDGEMEMEMEMEMAVMLMLT